MTGSINKRLMRPAVLSAGQNMAEIQLQRRSRDSRKLASLASLARVRVELARIRPPVSQPRRQFSFFRDSSFRVTQPLSKHQSHLYSLSTLRLWLSTNKPRDNDDSTVFSILVIDTRKFRGEGHAPILARLHFLTINVFGSCQCERPGTAG